MGTLVFVCPTSGQEISTGVEVDRSSYRKLSRTKTAIFCPRCRKSHKLSVIWAWLANETPLPRGERLRVERADNRKCGDDPGDSADEPSGPFLHKPHHG